MPVTIDFSQARAEHYLTCLTDGLPIQGLATPSDMLTLAGACAFATTTFGEALAGEAGPEEISRGVPPRWKDGLSSELLAALEVCAGLCELVYDMGYEDHYEPNLRVVVHEEAGRPKAVVIRGRRES